jgi:prophage regulatory protein
MANTKAAVLNAKERLLRMPEVRARTGMGATTIYRRMNEGTFPRPVDIGGRRVAWRESEVDEWIFAKIEASEREREVA